MRLLGIILATVLGTVLIIWLGVTEFGVRSQLVSTQKLLQSEQNGNVVYRQEAVKLANALDRVTAENNQLAAKLAECEAACKDQVYVVKLNDTLSAIAHHFLGRASRYHSLAKYNNIKNPDLIYPGDEIAIPCPNKLPRIAKAQSAPQPAKSAVQPKPAKTTVQISEAKPMPQKQVSTPQVQAQVPVLPVTSPAVPTTPTVAVPQTVQAPQQAAAASPQSNLVIPAPVASPPQKPAIAQVVSSGPESRNGPVLVSTAPGSAWSVAGNLSPVEAGNFLNYSHVEQGVTIWRNKNSAVVPFVSVDTTADNKGFDWNNKAVARAGVRYTRSFKSGVVSFGGGYAYERRFKSDYERGEPYGFSSFWFGRDMPTREPASRRMFSAFPGSTWGIVGNLSPAEKGNVQGQLYAQQGVTVTKLKGISLIPYVEDTLNVDTKKLVWNNRNIFGSGFKIAAPFGSGVLEIGAVYKDENRWLNHQRAGGVTGYVNFWYGWNPAIGR